jgi:hypothetical protein
MRFALALTMLTALAGPAAAQNPRGFTPGNGDASCAVPASISVSSTSSRTALDDANTCGASVILINVGATEAFYRLGTSDAVAAVTTDNALPANGTIVLSILQGQTYLAAITATGSTTIRVLQGTYH